MNAEESNQNQLDAILAYTYNYSDYYKKGNYTNLKDFPVMNKKNC